MIDHPSTASEVALALLAAADRPASSLRERLTGVLEVVRARLDATGVAAVLAIDAAETTRARIATAGELATDEPSPAQAARVAIGPHATLLVAPPGRLEGAGAEVAELAARVIARELDLTRREARAARSEDAISAVTHEMNNALTPLLCNPNEGVARDALRLRSLLDTLRQLRGRAHPRELRWVPAWLERAKRLLSIAGGGSFRVEARCADEARARTVGPEQGRLLPAFLSAGFALRASSPAGLELACSVEGGRVVLELAANVEPSAVLGDLDASAAPGFEVDVVLAPGQVRLRYRLVQRPRIVVVEGPSPSGGEAAARTLEGLGAEVVVVEGPQAMARVLEWPEPSAILVLADAHPQGTALRMALHRAQPLYASRCLFLDERLSPRHYRASPDEVDLAAALTRAPRPDGKISP